MTDIELRRMPAKELRAALRFYSGAAESAEAAGADTDTAERLEQARARYAAELERRARGRCGAAAGKGGDMLKCDGRNCGMSATCKCRDCARNKNCGIDCGVCRVTFRAGPVRIERLGGACVAVREKDGFNKVIVGIGV